MLAPVSQKTGNHFITKYFPYCVTYELKHKNHDYSSTRKKILKIEGAPLDAYNLLDLEGAEQLIFYLSNQKLNLLMILGIK